jgi:hypothetical protein
MKLQFIVVVLEKRSFSAIYQSVGMNSCTKKGAISVAAKPKPDR